jgi:hypothetical protein
METALTEIHLALNHLPIFLVAMSLVAITFGFVFKKDGSILAALAMQVVSGAAAVLIYFTGRSAQGLLLETYGPENFHPDLIKEYAEYIGKHEEIAEQACYFLWANGAIAAIFFIILLKRHDFARNVKLLLLPAVSALVGLAMAANAGYRGGHISHPEIRPEEVKIITNEMREYSWEDAPKSE